MQAVVFDVGNTLAHLDYRFLAAQAGVTHDRFAQAEALVRRTGWPQGAPFFPGYFGAVAERLGLETAATEALATAAHAEHRRRPSGLWNQVDPEAEAVLTALTASGLRLGVVSNADGRVEEQLRGFGLRAHFEAVVDSRVAGVAKPDPRIFHLLLGALAVPADEAVYVGDIYSIDVIGAQAAGMGAVLYDRWDAWPDATFPRIRRLGDLPGWLHGRGAGGGC